MIWDVENHQKKVYIVDANSDGYERLADDASRREVVFFRSAREALRTQADCEPAMWVINLDLPDMSGADLRSMLRSRGSRSPLALVSDQYSVEDEMTARAAGAEMYFAKPLACEVIAASA